MATTTRIFLPSPQNPVYRPAQAEPVLAEYLRLQCPAFRNAARPDSGVVQFSVGVSPTGQATRAELVTGSGDQLVDEVFGTIAAQLRFEVDSTGPRREQVRSIKMHYACLGDAATVQVRYPAPGLSPQGDPRPSPALPQPRTFPEGS